MMLKRPDNKHEYEFLPAVLEVQDSPPSPIGRMITWSIILLLVITVAWAAVGEVDMVAIAQGKIIPNGQQKVIQALEPGVIRAIHTHDGQQVTKGDLLLELDPTNSRADLERLKHELLVASLDAIRHKAIVEHDMLLEPNPKELFKNIETAADADLVALQSQLFQKQLNEYQSHQAVSDQTLQERQAELATIKSIVAKLEATLPIISKRAEALRTLSEQRLVPVNSYLELEQQRLEQQHDLSTQRYRLQEIEVAINSIGQQKTVLHAELTNKAVVALAESKKVVAALSKELAKAELRSQQQRLTAPVTGVVQQLAVHTIGGIVTQAQPLMVIIPSEQKLEAAVWVQNKDIGFVFEGQQSELKIETFSFTKYGTIDGEILNISNDAVENEKLGLVYAARVSLKTSVIQVKGRLANLTPGMAVTVEIKTGKRRLIDYFLSPIMQYQSESIRER